MHRPVKEPVVLFGLVACLLYLIHNKRLVLHIDLGVTPGSRMCSHAFDGGSVGLLEKR